MLGLDKVVPVDVILFGSRNEPKPVREGKDIKVEEDGIVKSQKNKEKKTGKSAFSFPLENAPLTGHYHTIKAGTELPNGLEIINDGEPFGEHSKGHYTIYPTEDMLFEEFQKRVSSIETEYGGKKVINNIYEINSILTKFQNDKKKYFYFLERMDEKEFFSLLSKRKIDSLRFVNLLFLFANYTLIIEKFYYSLIYLATVGTESEVINSIYLLKNIPYEWLRDKLKEVIPEIVELIKSEDEEEKHYVYNKILSLYYFLGYKEELDDFINNICKGHQIELIRELYDDWKDWKK